jgi:two-component system nitrate/nitrite response regulator NarL
MSTSTVIVAPSVLLRQGIASLLQGTRYKVVASAAKSAELSTARCPKGQSTLIIIGMDLQNANLDHAATSIGVLRSMMPDAKVVLVAEADKPIELQRVPMLSLDAGIFSLCSRDTLIKVLDLTFMDQHVFVFGKPLAAATEEDVDFIDPANVSPPSGSHELRNGANLSPRESEVLTSLAEGKSNKLIARVCRISEATVKVHLKAILRKTKAHNRTQAAIWAIQHGFRVSSNNGVTVESNGFAATESPTLAPVRQAVSIQSASQQSQTDLAATAPYSSARNVNKTR